MRGFANDSRTNSRTIANSHDNHCWSRHVRLVVCTMVHADRDYCALRSSQFRNFTHVREACVSRPLRPPPPHQLSTLRPSLPRQLRRPLRPPPPPPRNRGSRILVTKRVRTHPRSAPRILPSGVRRAGCAMITLSRKTKIFQRSSGKHGPTYALWTAARIHS